MFNICVGCIGWWLVGFAFAMGDVRGGFIGYNSKYFATSGLEDIPYDGYLTWVFYFSYASISASMVSGSMAERT